MIWRDVVYPKTANLIIGAKGSGKTGLGFYLIEMVRTEYGLSPKLVNFPEEFKDLVPPEYEIISLGEIADVPNSVILIDEGTTFLPAGRSKLEEMVKSMQSMSRQRNQVILIIFHASSDVGSRIMRGLDVIMIKRPSKRQIQFGSKDNETKALLRRARKKIPHYRKDLVLVDADEPEYSDIMSNDLPPFWSDELSTAWGRAGTGTKIDIDDLKAKSPQSDGECMICHKEGHLWSGVCEDCFLEWCDSIEKGRAKPSLPRW